MCRTKKSVNYISAILNFFKEGLNQIDSKSLKANLIMDFAIIAFILLYLVVTGVILPICGQVTSAFKSWALKQNIISDYQDPNVLALLIVVAIACLICYLLSCYMEYKFPKKNKNDQKK